MDRMVNSNNRMILCLGSNLNKEKNMECAVNLLRTHFISARFSAPMITKPINCSSSSFFMNQVAIIESDLNLEKMKAVLKQIERTIGRKPEDKAKGLIPIDIDLLTYNDLILKEEDLSRDYVQKGLQSLLFSRKNNERGKNKTNRSAYLYK